MSRPDEQHDLLGSDGNEEVELAAETDLEEEDLDEGEEEEGDEEEGGLEGRRLQLIPHTVDPNKVFRFEFGPAILAQVLEKIDKLDPIPLQDVSSAVAPYPGFYQLFRNRDSVYVGRTIRPVATRLGEHRKKLRGRVPLSEMYARFLFVEDLSLVGLSEDAMIAYFHPLGLDPWGKMGFGSKPAGFGRAKQESNWHAVYPPDTEIEVEAGHPRPRTLIQLIRLIAKGAPVVLAVPGEFKRRFEEDHPGTFQTAIQKRCFTEWMEEVEGRFADGWYIRKEAMAWYIVHRDG